MGACQYGNAWKNCATCSFWQGPRKLDPSRQSVTVDNNAQGQCDGFWKGARKMCNQKCSEWRKWAELQEWSGEVRHIYP